MISFIDKNGQRTPVNLQEGNPMHIYAQAAKEGLSVRQYINKTYPTTPESPYDTFTQMCLSAGLRFKKNQETGEPAANLLEVLNPMSANTNQTGGVHTNYPQVPDSRLLFPAAVMEAVESAIRTKETEAMGAFAGLIAQTDTINSDRWEQPVIALDGKKGPEDSAWRRIAQNAPPPLMLSITSSDVTRTVPTKAVGLSISHKVLQNNTLDLIGTTLEHFYVKSDYSEWVSWLGLILSGDTDATNTPMATAKSALSSITAASLDSSIVAAGVLTQNAWVQYLYRNSLSLRKTHIVTDLNGALALDNRTNRPTVNQNNSIDRIDVPFQMVYPYGQTPINVLAMPTGTWSANTYMGLDSTQAIGKVISSSADYEAFQDMVLLRKMEFIFTRGYILYRRYDSAFDVMTLTV